jgi:hypothetical protein
VDDRAMLIKPDYRSHRSEVYAERDGGWDVLVKIRRIPVRDSARGIS